MIFFRELLRSRVVVISESVASVKPGCILIRTHRRFCCTRVHRNTGSAKLNSVESIARGLLEMDVPGHPRDRGDLYVGRAQCHYQSHCIVGSSVCVDEKDATHARQNSRTDPACSQPTLWPKPKRCRVTRFPRETACSRRKRLGLRW